MLATSFVSTPPFLLISITVLPDKESRPLKVMVPRPKLPGAKVPPLWMVVGPLTLPVPPNVPPAEIVTVQPAASDPFTSKVPAVTVMGLAKVLAPERRRVPDPDL